MLSGKRLFENYKQCALCKCPLPLDYQEEYCPSCVDVKLFQEVKDYIRENDVNEYDVAQHFEIPLKQVKAWIREGRIEYKEKSEASIAGLHCQHCGAPVSFGTLCPKCLKLLNGRRGYEAKHTHNVDDKMHYLDK